MKKDDYLSQEESNIVKNDDGQTLVEFLLLLASIVIIAFSFMRLFNANLTERWTRMAQTILEDDNQTLRAR